MTREKALKIVVDGNNIDKPYHVCLIETLEALGLLKFEEEIKKVARPVFVFKGKNGVEYEIKDEYIGCKIDKD